ncbi:single-stranded DNA-binding protein [Leucobacter sp. NPDC077196]|uniref:single-stranded DNA-binding protein n=1 Tax=Leucobacter sp. NPDC077196 TaxID=3154959 RepID=UPI0034293EE2
MSKASFSIEGFAAEPKQRTSQNGKRMLDISVAHTERRKNKQSGEWENATDRDGNEITLWARATFFDEQADLLAQQVAKGTLVRIEGMPRLNAYVDNSGTAKASIDVQFASLSIIPRASSGGSGGGSWAPAPQQSQGGFQGAQNDPGASGGGFDSAPF